ncbi:helix-turn-helix domain-containing protein [Tenacibaculum sp. XPcli2-G]|uniref:helix-turn-helix domain-containing protein n=1 Tax=Tenacibaculum sp. XPcli2-G TaxID=2954503 RepID=UPI0020981F0B|nr:helix-turn-helix domain-containing protein [Tenacibaculum sp. XPcli2-G]MCO7185060.1 helix-turn-helix domain-containing protein [Tenacibaculum sp. XPcli2-G]
MEGFRPGYYAIIPAKVRYDNRLTPNAKLLYGEITALCNEKGFCWATNRYFSELYGVRIETISVWISSLEKCGHINTKIIYRKGTKHILNRYIEIYGEGILKNLNTPIEKILKDNNTSNLIVKSNNYLKEKKSLNPRKK